MHANGKEYAPVKKLDFKSNDQTVFYVFLRAVLLSTLWIGVEAFSFFVGGYAKYLRYKWIKNGRKGKVVGKIHVALGRSRLAVTGDLPARTLACQGPFACMDSCLLGHLPARTVACEDTCLQGQ
ncbi:unnamed protein product, partial [Orchesella dallaii]